MISLDQPLTEINGVGPALAEKFAVLNIETVEQLIDNYPRKYDDYSLVTPVKDVKPGVVTLKATFSSVGGRYVRRGMHITEAIASDKTGSVRIVWFNQPYREAALKLGEEYYISGKFELSYQKMALLNPACELVKAFPLSTARIVPIYRETKGLSSNQIRKAVHNALGAIKALPETLPDWLLKEHKLIPRAQAIETMHFPASMPELETAKKRLASEEVFGLTLAALLNKEQNQTEKGIRVPFNENLAKSFVRELPFKLTDDQRRVVWQIYQDMSGDKTKKLQPMNRLLEGDVGSGKTVVATMAGLMAMEQGMQVAFMAPTELLAQQHAETIYNLLKPLGFESQICLLTGSMKAAQKTTARARIASGEARMIIGTHALIAERVNMKQLALVIIDEQHRFGVEQRRKLQKKAGHMPHVLTMTATPIPRSLALTLYGEMDISIIATKPKGRIEIATSVVSPNSRAQLYKAVEEQIKAGRQVFVVCPLVNDSRIMRDKQSAENVYEKLRLGPFKHRKLGLLHGQMKSEDKARIMQDFVDHKLDMLISTTVIEVGVDVPNATVMIIENADRFGLAQLHQLRGRVGRSEHQGFCYLVMSDSSAPTRRLRAMTSTNNGFKLSELDLELRGPGAIYGTMQHGQLDLRVAKLTDTVLIANARLAAQEFIERHENLLQYTQLARQVERYRSISNLN